MKKEYGGFVLGSSARCTGCQACVIACFDAHRKSEKGRTIGNIHTAVESRVYMAEAAHKRMPIQCRHCENAPCLASCQSGAITREDEVVILRSDLCIGCKNCITVCPLGAIEISKSSGKSTFLKCDCCGDREIKACIAACPNEVLRWVDPEAETKEKRIQAVRSMMLL